MKIHLLILIILSSFLASQVPNTISWQGLVTDEEGNYLSGTHDITVKLYDTHIDGTELWSETHSSIDIEDGLVNIILGSVQSLDLDFSAQYWLEIIVDAGTPMTRIALNSVPYSMYSKKSSGVIEADSLVLKDSEGDTRFVLNPETGTFKMMDNDTVWYELSVNSPVKNKILNSNGTYVITDGDTYKKLYDDNDVLIRETKFKDGIKTEEKYYYEGSLSKSATFEKDANNSAITIEKADYYENGTLIKSQENKLENDKLIYSKQIVNGKIYDEYEISYEGLNNEITVEKNIYYKDGVKSNTFITKEKEGVEIENTTYDKDDVIQEKYEKSFEGDNNEITVEKKTTYENGNSSKIFVSKVKDDKEVEFIEYESEGYINLHKKVTYTDPHKVDYEITYYDGQGNFLSKEVTTEENGKITKSDKYTLTSVQHVEYDNGILVTNKSSHSKNNPYGDTFTFNEDEVIDYFEDGYIQKTETKEYQDANGDNYLKEQKIVNGSSGYIANHVENQDGNSYTRIVQNPENVTVLAEKNKTIGNTETTKNHEVGKNIYAKGTKCFRITHPEKSIKYLVHASIESNEVLNKYSGNVTTDNDSLATVTLPSYFENVNTDYRYTLTVINTNFVQAIIYSEINEDNEFVIKTNAPSVKVSWEVTGRRNDSFMKDNPFEDEPYK